MSRFKVAVFTLLLLFTHRTPASAVCPVGMVDLLDICVECMLPIKVGGFSFGDMFGFGTTLPNPPDIPQANIPWGVCPIPIPPFVRPGVPISLWEPVATVEVVKDEWCFPTYGISLGSTGRGTGAAYAGEDITTMFANAHYNLFPLFEILQLFTDVGCLQRGEMSPIYFTELIPWWSDDRLALYLFPETLLFNNMIAQLACVWQSVQSNITYPNDALFWCTGWGGIYPTAGHVNSNKTVKGSALIAARLVYHMNRELVILNNSLSLCTPVPTPVMKQSDYRFQILRPGESPLGMQIGKSTLIWGSLKNRPWPGGDNFVFAMYQKLSCLFF